MRHSAQCAAELMRYSWSQRRKGGHMTLDERIFWWLTICFFVWFAAFPAHAATAEFSGYGIDEVASEVCP